MGTKGYIAYERARAHAIINAHSVAIINVHSIHARAVM